MVDTGDVTILKFKKISELPCGKPVNQDVKEYLDNWIKLGEHKEYLSKVIHVLRDIFTIVRTQKPTKATSRDY